MSEVDRRVLMCPFNRGGVWRAYEGKKDCYPDECSMCGWNPKEQSRRKYNLEHGLDALAHHKKGEGNEY